MTLSNQAKHTAIRSSEFKIRTLQNISICNAMKNYNTNSIGAPANVNIHRWQIINPPEHVKCSDPSLIPNNP